SVVKQRDELAIRNAELDRKLLELRKHVQENERSNAIKTQVSGGGDRRRIGEIDMENEDEDEAVLELISFNASKSSSALQNKRPLFANQSAQSFMRNSSSVQLRPLSVAPSTHGRLAKQMKMTELFQASSRS